jgi:transposase
MLDLYRAPRDELVALVLALRQQNADLERRLGEQQAEVAVLRAAVADLTARVGAVLAAAAPEEPPDAEPGGTPRGMPGLKPGPPPARPGRPRRQRARGFGRRRMEPTARQIHAIDACPNCRLPLRGGTVARTREVIDVPAAPAVVTEHVYLERRCPRCGGCWSPGPELAGAVVGQGRLGVGLLSLVAWLREEARLPFAVIQRYLAQVHGLELSVGALVGAVATVAARAQPAVERALATIRGSPVVHVDETGWREDGANGYVWTLSTPGGRYFVRGSRERAVLETALGPEFGGVLVSDFYAAYTTYDGARHQYCWAHLLRDVDDLVRQHPRDAGVRGWADALHRLFGRARTFADPDPAARVRARQGFEADLAAVCAPYLPVPAAPREATSGQPEVGAMPQATLCRRIEKHLGELFVFVEDPAVPPTNNAAERSLRHLVTCRKISGGTRSGAGTETKLTVASLFGTWRAQGRNPLAQCRQLLADPPV